ncbi:Hypothetical predicted protein [Pelobates cultripes]|uniref:Uncharacterized protein n=1 Tax=Pelobates cultripes TaxID=61616 RepID=A0AAD1W5F2_PELCU|nr:Hypothetical predicted protein [Pelobates cultripes]
MQELDLQADDLKGDLPYMVETAYVIAASDDPPDLMSRLDQLLDDFWRQLEHRMSLCTPLQPSKHSHRQPSPRQESSAFSVKNDNTWCRGGQRGSPKHKAARRRVSLWTKTRSPEEQEVLRAAPSLTHALSHQLPLGLEGLKHLSVVLDCALLVVGIG